MYGLSAGINLSGRCGEVTISGGSTVVFSIYFSLLVNVSGYLENYTPLYLSVWRWKNGATTLVCMLKTRQITPFYKFSTLPGESVQAMIRMPGFF